MSNVTADRTCVSTSRQSSRICGKHVLRDMPVDLCYEHAFLVYLHMHGSMTASLKEIHDARTRSEMGEPVSEIIRKEAHREQSVVYYARIGDYIKIGFTENLLSRIQSLRIDRVDILATEPGGREKESERHRQFADIRRGRRENFERTPDLLTHIAKVRRENGPPKMTGYVTVEKAAAAQDRASWKKRLHSIN